MKPTSSRRIALALAVAPFCFAPAAQADGDDARMDLGRQIFTETAQPPCALCHTLADAGATGEIGPILDVMRPSYDVVMTALLQGIGPMMPYDDHLSEEELDALAHYVSTVAGAAN